MQLSDTHFSSTGERSHGGFGYDTEEAFAAVFDHGRDAAERADLIVVTGDIADHGLPDEYDMAASAFGRFDTPVHLIPGNHDFHMPFHVGLPRPAMSTQRTLRCGPWLFVFVDSNHDGRQLGPRGELRDHPDRVELANGGLGPAETDWLDQVLDASSAEHVFLWVHHPPAMPGIFAQPGYDAEVEGLLATHDRVRGIAAGHVHTDQVVEISGRPIFVCPALTINIDFAALTTLPPGYRTLTFADDGTVDSTCHLLDGERWPRQKLPRRAVEYLRGEIGWDDLMDRA